MFFLFFLRSFVCTKLFLYAHYFMQKIHLYCPLSSRACLKFTVLTYRTIRIMSYVLHNRYIMCPKRVFISHIEKKIGPHNRDWGEPFKDSRSKWSANSNTKHCASNIFQPWIKKLPSLDTISRNQIDSARRALSQLCSFKIRYMTFLDCIKFFDPRTLRL